LTDQQVIYVEKPRSKKRAYAIVGALGGLAIGAGAFAFAAVGGATVSSVVSSTDAVATCDGDGYVVELGAPTYSAAVNDYQITTVNVVGLDVTAAGCATQTLQIDITDAANQSIASVSHSIVADTDPGTLTLSNAVEAQQVNGMATVIFDPTTP